MAVVLSMVVEALCLYAYLKDFRSSRWILCRFFLANVLSAAAGPLIPMTLYLNRDNSAAINLSELTWGAGTAYAATLFIEGLVFLVPFGQEKSGRIFRAVVMSNFFSYATIVFLFLRPI